MRRYRLGHWMVLISLAVVLVVVGGCGGSTGNNAPEITGVSSSPENVGKGGSTTVVCEATDADGDALTYDWTATQGTFQGSGDTVTWLAPNEEGTYTVRVTVSDGKGGTAEGTCSVAVVVGLGSINITSIPEAANVYLDGVDTGKVTPCVLSDLAQGSYTLKLTYYHYEWREGTVSIGAEPVTYVDWTLQHTQDKTQVIQHGPGDGNDAYVYQDAQDTNYGDEIYLYVGAVLVDEFNRSYLEFDTTTFPSTAVVTEATLELFYFDSLPEVNTLVGVYQVMNDWEESHINWANAATFAADAISTVNLAAEATQDWEAWDVTTLVQGWLDGSIENNGVVLKDTDEGTVKAAKGFYSSHHSNFSRRPTLTITYFNPAPSS